VIGGGTTTVPVLVDTPILIRDLQEHLPRKGGGFWLDDPDVQRGGLPYISFTTQSESFTGSTAVSVTLDGDAIGTVTMGNSLGADYQLSIPDPVLDQLMPQILSDHALTLGFDAASPLDQFRLAVDEDSEISGFTPLDYGISVGALLSSEATLPEPSSLALASLALSALLCRYRKTRRPLAV
jgi:hypothetical protein